MPFDIQQNDPAPPVQPFDVALKELVEALGEWSWVTSSDVTAIVESQHEHQEAQSQ